MKQTDAQNPDNRKPGLSCTLLLLVGSCLPILGAVLLAPLLPEMQKHFEQADHAEVLVPMVLTMPALMIGLIGPFAGSIADRFGRRRLLLWSLGLYSVVGTAPLWIDDLTLILITRLGLGLAETGIITACTALIGDYFEGEARKKTLALQTVASSLSASLFFALGGMLGELGWRVPFWLYAVGFLMLPWAAAVVWEPLRDTPTHPSEENQKLARFPWLGHLPVFGLAWATGATMFVVAVQLGFLLDGIGINSPKLIGLAIASSHLALFLGALTTRITTRVSPGLMGVGGFALMGAGLFMLSISQSYTQVVMAILINGYGIGLMIPTLASWALDGLSIEQRGRGSGGFMASFYLGEFMSPIVVFGVGAALSVSLTATISIIAQVCGVLAVSCFFQWALARGKHFNQAI